MPEQADAARRPCATLGGTKNIILAKPSKAWSKSYAARDMIVDGPDQLWVADLTYLTVAVGFVYVAVIMDA